MMVEFQVGREVLFIVIRFQLTRVHMVQSIIPGVNLVAVKC